VSDRDLKVGRSLNYRSSGPATVDSNGGYVTDRERYRGEGKHAWEQVRGPCTKDTR
jgi:hypothetical protein